MRDFKNMKRQRGRNRGGGSGNSGGGGKPQQNVNRAFDSNGPDNVKIRGHAQHVFEKYQQLARDAFASGDRVLAENYLQHADHYFRVLRTIQPQRPAAEILGRDVFASGLDIDFEEEMDGEEGADGQVTGENEPAMDGQFQDRPAQDRPAQDRAGQDRSGQDNRQNQGRFDNRRDFDGRNDRYDGRQDNRYEARPDNRSDNRSDVRPEQSRRDAYEPRDRNDNRDARDNREPRQGGYDRQPRRFREERPAREEFRNGAATETDARDPMSVVSVAAQASSFPVAELPEAEGSPMLRSQDGGLSEAPAFLQGGDDGEARRPRTRRRRAPRGFEGDQAGGDASTSAAAPEDA